MRSFTYDTALLLKDSVAVTATGAAQVAAVAKVFDTGFVSGGPNALFKGVAVIDVTNIKTSTGDETYTLIIQGSNSPTFASGIENLAEIDLGATAVRKGGAITSPIGRYEISFQNEQADVMYEYIRMYFVIAGTTPTITNTCFIGRDFLAT